MVNPGSFKGARKSFLLAEKATYSEAVQGDYVRDALAEIQRRYFKRFPIDLPHDEEPSSEHLASVDDSAPEPEPEEPVEEELGPEAYSKALQEVEDRGKLIVFRKAQIKRWLVYQHMKDNGANLSETGSQNPYQLLLHQLTGIQPKRPRLRTAANIWRKTRLPEIEKEVQRRANDLGWAKSKLAPLREKVTKELYDALPPGDKDRWVRRAKKEHDELLKKHEEEVRSPPGTDPTSRQRCIQGLTEFVIPILDLICEGMGWKASLIAGGPEPAHGGRLNVVCVHSGTTLGDVKMNFGRAERSRYLTQILPIYGDFLRKCYTVDECKSRALPEDADFEKMIDLDFDESLPITVDTLPETQDAVVACRRTLECPPTLYVSRSASPRGSPSPSHEASAHCLDGSVPPHDAHPASRDAPVRNVAVPLPNTPVPPSHNIDAAVSRPQSVSSPICDTSAGQSALPGPTTPPPAGSNHDISVNPQNHDAAVLSVQSQSFSQPLVSAVSPDPLPVPHGASQPSHLIDIDGPENIRPCALPTNRSVSSPICDTSAGQSALPGPTTPPPAGSNHDISVNPQDHDAAVLSVQSQSPSQPLVSAVSPDPLPVPHGESQPSHLIDIDGPENIRPCALPTNKSATSQAPLSAADSRPKTREQTRKDATETTTSIIHSKRNRTDSELQLPSNKRSRKSSSNQTNDTPSDVTPAKEPKWFVNGVDMFITLKLGDEWTKLVEEWMHFERQENFIEAGRLSCTGRPGLVHDWIARKRLASWRPSIDNLKGYEEQFNTWWAHLQPAWRVSDGKVKVNCVAGDWSCLRMPGSNGLQSVLAALFFWGQATQENTTCRMRWVLAVEDCFVALSNLRR